MDTAGFQSAMRFGRFGAGNVRVTRSFNIPCSQSDLNSSSFVGIGVQHPLGPSRELGSYENHRESVEKLKLACGQAIPPGPTTRRSGGQTCDVDVVRRRLVEGKDADARRTTVRAALNMLSCNLEHFVRVECQTRIAVAVDRTATHQFARAE